MKKFNPFRNAANHGAIRELLTVSRSGRGVAAVVALAAGSAVALAGGRECRLRSEPPPSGTRVDPSSATAMAAGALPLMAVPGGYCPGGLPPRSPEAIGRTDAGEPEAVMAALDEMDAVDAAMIAKAPFAVATKVHSVKYEPASTDNQAGDDSVRKVELSTSAYEDWSILVDARTGLIAKKIYPLKKALTTSAAEIEDLALHNPESEGGTAQKSLDAARLNEMGCDPPDSNLDDVAGKAIDMFEAIDLVALKLEEFRKNYPDPVPAVKITDRPQPKSAPSTGAHK